MARKDGSKAGRDGGAAGRQGPGYADMREGSRHRNAQDGRDRPLMKSGSLVNAGPKNADYRDQAQFKAPISLKAGGTPLMFKPNTGLSSQGISPSTPAVKAAQQPRFTSPGGGFVAKGGIPGEKTSRGNPFQGRDKPLGGDDSVKARGMSGPAKMWGSGGDKAHGQPKNKMWGNNRRSGGP